MTLGIEVTLVVLAIITVHSRDYGGTDPLCNGSTTKLADLLAVERAEWYREREALQAPALRRSDEFCHRCNDGGPGCHRYSYSFISDHAVRREDPESRI